MKREEAISYLEGVNGKNIKLGLEQIQALMEKINRPDEKLQIIHIAGTNGKGSVSQFISQILQKAGYTVGCFNSPYFQNPNECVRINEEMISDNELIGYMNRLEPSIKALREANLGPSGFEVLTALAFWYFYEKKVDFVILEVGLGGALDATNVINQSLVSVLTKIAVDHKDFLGDTLEAIALQKAGIIKANGLVVAPEQDEVVMKVINETCRHQEAELEWMSPTRIKEVVVNEEGTTFEVEGMDYKLQMIGSHQAYNCALALKVVEVLRERKAIAVTNEQIQQGVYKAKWPGRWERMLTCPNVFIDGAHNVDGIKSLAQTMDQLKKDYTIGIVGILRDKEVDEMLSIICPRFDVLIVTTPHNPRAIVAEVLAEKIKQYPCEVYIDTDIQNALEHALHLAKGQLETQIIGFGSLYMIGTLRHLLVQKQLEEAERLRKHR